MFERRSGTSRSDLCPGAKNGSDWVSTISETPRDSNPYDEYLMHAGAICVFKNIVSEKNFDRPAQMVLRPVV
jgi:hypothetical protein